jgi:hypothetical protein
MRTRRESEKSRSRQPIHDGWTKHEQAGIGVEMDSGYDLESCRETCT